jgi:hypothetical protein
MEHDIVQIGSTPIKTKIYLVIDAMAMYHSYLQ